MPTIFTPTEKLDVSTDPSMLPQEVNGNTIVSGAMQRCKNLRLNQMGVAITRDGYTKVGSSVASPIWKILEQDGSRYTFAGTRIYLNESSIATGLTSAQWSALTYNPFNSITRSVYSLNGTDRKRIEGSSVFEWGIDEPDTEPSVVKEVGGALIEGTFYSYKFTYARLEGTTVVSESNSSPESEGIEIDDANKGIVVFKLNTATDSQITHVRIYRAEYTDASLSDSAIYYFLATQTSTDPNYTDDGSTTFADLGGALHTNHNRPPIGTYVDGPNYNGTLFIIKDNLLYFCLAKQPDYWPTTNFIEVSPIDIAGQLIVFHAGQPYYLSKHKIYLIQGSGVNTFFPLKMESITGAQGPQAAISVQGYGIFHVGLDGIYVFDSSTDRNITEREFQPIFRGETVHGIPGATNLQNSWLIQDGNKVYFGYPGGGSRPTEVLVYNLDTQKTQYFDYNLTIRTVEYDKVNDRILAGGSTVIYHIDNKSAKTDNGSAISWEIESKSFTLQTRKNFPRQIKYDIDASEASVTGAVIVDDEVLQEHTITGNRDTTRRLVKTGNGDKLSNRISGTGPAKIYMVESE